MSTAILWFRNNLRIHDNKALHHATNHEQIIPVYIFDLRFLDETSFGFPKTGAHRYRFLRESVKNLRDNLQELGSDLVIRQGHTEHELDTIQRQNEANVVISQKEVTSEELEIEHAVARETDADLQFCSDLELFHPDDIPYEHGNIPKVFTNFRKQLEKKSDVREEVPTPNSLPQLDIEDHGVMPSFSDVGLEKPNADDRAVLPFKGGEDAALQRLNDYFWKQNRLKDYKFTRNGLLGADYSSKFSPWLANGTLSPRRIYWQVQEYEDERKDNVSTYWMIFELIWRDFFRYSAIRYGDDMFKAGGIQHKERNWRRNENDFERWAQGQTGIPFIDANMRELNATGYMSNRGRQNVASFLAQNLNIDWRMGAQYFESKLIDYDPCSNYGNWMYNSTVGQNPRNRYFNIVKQANKYDKKGEYVKHWIPELQKVSAEFVHEPHNMTVGQQKLADVSIGDDYPEPMINLEESYQTIRDRD